MSDAVANERDGGATRLTAEYNIETVFPVLSDDEELPAKWSLSHDGRVFMHAVMKDEIREIAIGSGM